MRDYDSDTGYRSEQELMKFRQQQEQMFTRLEIPSKGDNYSEVVPVYSQVRRKRDGYSSDLEGYSQRGAGVAYRDFTDNQAKINNAHGLPNALNQSHNQSLNESSPRTVHNEQNISNSQPVHYPSSPSPLHRSVVVDQSTPVTPKHYVAVDPATVRSQGSVTKQLEDLYLTSDHRDNPSPVDPQNRYMVRLLSFVIVCFLTLK